MFNKLFVLAIIVIVIHTCKDNEGNDNWRFILSTKPNCNCHLADISQGVIVQDYCKKVNLTIADTSVYSITANLHAHDYGYAYFYRDFECKERVLAIPLKDNSGETLKYPIYNMQEIIPYKYNYACYCKGNSGPCDC